jgi:pimeloyl-ACP methyl ester carboxylesterase
MSKLVELPLDQYQANSFAEFEPAKSEFHLPNARAMMWASQLAYETDAGPAKVRAITDRWGLGAATIIKTDETDTPLTRTRGVVFEAKNATIVAFAGTDPLVLPNLITDFNLGWSGLLQWIPWRDNVWKTAHRGFEMATDAAWNQISSLLSGWQGKPVFITGHSLGAAIAMLTADRTDTGTNPPVVYTFGQPRAFIASKAKEYDARMGHRSFRMRHGDDIVPAVPPAFLGYRHAGRYLSCGSGQTFQAGGLSTAASDDPDFADAAFDGILSDMKSLVTLRAQPQYRTDPLWKMTQMLPVGIANHLPDRYLHALGALRTPLG